MNTLPTSGFELPDRYEKDQLHLMVRDAHTLFVYWEVSNRKRWLCSQHFECDYGILPKILRVYNVSAVYFNGGNAHHFFDIETTAEAHNWYIHHLQANTTYIIDLGVYTIERQLIPLLRSNAVVTPRDAPAQWGEPLQPVFPEVHEAGTMKRRIPPRDFENMTAYHSFMK